MSKLILTEWIELSVDQNVITEATANPHAPFVIKNVLLQKANTKNHNGRIYPMEILTREIKKYTPVVQERRALAELDHPESAVVELNNVSHLITHICMLGEEVRGDIEVLNTPKGQILKNLLMQKVKLGISSRGIGSLQKEEVAVPGEAELDIVQDDFELICFDCVSSPSTPGAYLVTEGKSYSVTDRYNKLRTSLHDILGEQYFK
jgi:hypothetical protein